MSARYRATRVTLQPHVLLESIGKPQDHALVRIRDRSLFMAGGDRRHTWGGVENILRFKEWASKKNQEAMSGRRKNFLPKNFAAGAASFNILNYPFTWTKSLHNVHIHSIIKHICFYLQEWASKNFHVMSSGPRIFSSTRQVGRENIFR